ncbi:MAG: tRNA 2-thiouridine(34) synthase MnmA [Minisyncoccia bacterium]
MSNNSAQKTVFVGMSGGVDSSVSAYLLKKAGYNVVGVFIQVWQPEGFPCTAKEDRLDAMRVAAQLEIPFLTLDLEKEYKEGVIDYMLEEYKKGNTPNPDVMCNREVKFGAFLRWACAHGADFVATGHYAQVTHTKNESKILTSVDTEKDQTYFLWTLTQDQIRHILFPIGHLKKSEVRVIAEKEGLYTAPKKDSQGLCFVGTISFKDLLKLELKPEKGNILNKEGEIVGVHDGAILYTKGERHGFTITKKSPHDEKLFIIDRDIEKNTITVSTQKPESNEDLLTNIITIKNYSCTRITFTAGQKCLVRLRYRAQLFPCAISEVTTDTVTIQTEALVSITEGQSAVLYSVDNTELYGGGIIT